MFADLFALLAIFHFVLHPLFQVYLVFLIQKVLHLSQFIFLFVQLLLHFFALWILAFILLTTFLPKSILMLGEQSSLPLFHFFSFLVWIKICLLHFSNLFTCQYASQNFCSKLSIFRIFYVLQKSSPMVFILPFFFPDWGVVLYVEQSFTNIVGNFFHMTEDRFVIELELFAALLYSFFPDLLNPIQ